MLKKENGVTLVALVITIIVLLILAGVVLTMVMGDSGIFGRANQASEQTKISSAKDAVRLATLELVTQSYSETTGAYTGTLTPSSDDAAIRSAVNAQLVKAGNEYTIANDGKILRVAGNEDTTVTVTFQVYSSHAIIPAFNK